MSIAAGAANEEQSEMAPMTGAPMTVVAAQRRESPRVAPLQGHDR